MDRWIESLPKPDGTDPHTWQYFAIDALNEALLDESIRDADNPNSIMLTCARNAAAGVRAWRESLPDQGEPVDITVEDWYPNRGLLLTAIVCIADSDSTVLDHNRTSAYSLRWAEAYLQALGLRLMDGSKGTEKAVAEQKFDINGKELKPGQRVRWSVEGIVRATEGDERDQSLWIDTASGGEGVTLKYFDGSPTAGSHAATIEILSTECPALLYINDCWYTCDQAADANGTHDGPHANKDAGAEWRDGGISVDAEEEHVSRGPFVPTEPVNQDLLNHLVEKAQAQPGPILPEAIGSVIEASTSYDETPQKRELFVLVGNDWIDKDGNGYARESLIDPIVRHLGFERPETPTIGISNG